jgi:hypothetical protein
MKNANIFPGESGVENSKPIARGMISGNEREAPRAADEFARAVKMRLRWCKRCTFKWISR